MKGILAAFLAFVGFTTAAILVATGQIGPRTTLSLGLAPELDDMRPALARWAEANRIDLVVDTLDGARMARALDADPPHDALWADSSLWLRRADPDARLTDVTPLTRTPVVLALRTRIAQELGWTGRDDVTLAEMAQAARDGWFRLGLPSASQTGTGALAYLGAFEAQGGLDAKALADPARLTAMREFLSGVHRTAGSGAALADLVVAHPDRLDAMLTTEAQAIRANRMLADRGGSPLYVVYPADLDAVADGPLAFVPAPGGDTDRADAFAALSEALAAPDMQAELARLGLRPRDAAPDPTPWDADQGLQAARAVAPTDLPDPALTDAALALYQTTLRKPALTVWVLDVSGSMAGAPVGMLRRAMTRLLDPVAASAALLQPTGQDVTIILPFNHSILDPIRVETASPTALDRALRFFKGIEPEGGRDVYYALYEAFEELAPYAEDGTLDRYLPAIVVMTHGPSDTESREALLAHRDTSAFAAGIPVHTVAYGTADPDQLAELARISGGQSLTAGADLVGAMIAARALNN